MHIHKLYLNVLVSIASAAQNIITFFRNCGFFTITQYYMHTHVVQVFITISRTFLLESHNPCALFHTDSFQLDTEEIIQRRIMPLKSLEPSKNRVRHTLTFFLFITLIFVYVKYFITL